MNNSKAFEHILEARAIMARVTASLAAAAVVKEVSQVEALPPEAAEIPTEARAALETSHELAPETHSEPGFGPEPDGFLELPWVSPEIAPPWVGMSFSELESDEFSSFRRDEVAGIEVEPLNEPPAIVAVQAVEAAPLIETPPVEIPAEETLIAEIPCAADEPEAACELEPEPTPPASSEDPSFMRRAGFIALAVAAVIVLMMTIGQELDRGFSTASNNHIAIDADENRPLVDLTASAISPMEQPIVVITDESGIAPAPPPASIGAIDKASPKKAISDFLTRLAESGRNFFTSTAWAAEAAVMPAQEVETEAVADEGVPTPSDDAAKSEAPDEAANLYTVETSRNSFTVGETAEVVFTLKEDGRAIDGKGLEIHFEANPHFPNLRTVSRTLDKNGAFTVKGLRPGQSGSTSLRLTAGGDALEIPVTVKGAKPVPPAAKPQALEQPLERPPMAIKPGQPLPAAPAVQPNEWTISPGLLRGQLESWSAQAGYQLVWKARNDFEMFSQASFQGDFTGAVQKLFHGMHSQGSGLLRATIYQGNKVLEVTEE